MNKLLILLGLISLLACAKRKQTPFELTINSPTKIASEQGKFWSFSERYQDDVRLDLTHCDSVCTFEFKLDGSVNTYFSDSSLCYPAYNGSWTFFIDKKGYSYLKIDDYWGSDTITVKLSIDTLSANKMRWQYSTRNVNGMRTTYSETLTSTSLR